jgi:hypothetical protein
MSTLRAGFHSCADAAPATMHQAIHPQIAIDTRISSSFFSCRGGATPGPRLQDFIVYTKRGAVIQPRIDDDRFAPYASRTRAQPTKKVTMNSYRPAEIGMPLAEVDTPALILDLDAFERNLDRMDASLAGKKIRIRPHAKSHKCPEIALRQINRGAVGICCQKVSEAEAMVEGGVPDVLIANEVVGAPKLKRLAALAKRARVAVCADDAGNVAALDEAARVAGVKLNVLVEINVGANRCGVEPGEPALRLAQVISRSTNLRFGGLQAYQGAAQHLR